MQIDIHQTVATVYRGQVTADHRVLIVVLTLITDKGIRTTGVQMTNNRIFIAGPYIQVQDEDGVFLAGLDGVHITTFRPDILAAPNERVAFTD